MPARSVRPGMNYMQYIGQALSNFTLPHSAVLTTVHETSLTSCIVSVLSPCFVFSLQDGRECERLLAMQIGLFLPEWLVQRVGRRAGSECVSFCLAPCHCFLVICFFFFLIFLAPFPRRGLLSFGSAQRPSPRWPARACKATPTAPARR